MEAYLDWQKKGGIKLNDVIEEYRYVAAGKQIKAGDLVNYINGVASKTDYGESLDTQLSSETYTGNAISAVQLDENRVFVAHGKNQSYPYLYGIVCTINGNKITYGKDTQLNSLEYCGASFSIGLLPNGNVFIAHVYGSAYSYLSATIVSVDGTEIKVESFKNSSLQNRTNISTCILPNGNVFIAYNYSSKLYGIICSTEGTSMTFGTETQLSSSSSTANTISTCLLPNGNVFIAHSYGSNYYLYGMVCSISGTTITKGSDTALNTDQYAGGNSISTCLLPNGDVFIAHCYGSDSLLYGIVISVNGTTISKGTDVHLGDGRYFTGYAISTCLLPNGDVFIAHNWDRYDYYLYGMIVSIDGTTITKKTDIALSDTTFQGQVISALLLSNGTIFIAHSNTEDKYYLYAQIFAIDYENNVPTKNIVITEYEQQVTPAIEPPFNAVALSSGVGAPEYVLGAKKGNIFPTTWAKVTEGTKYSSADGYILEASSYYNYNFYLYYACDGVSDRTSAWKSKAGISSWVKMTLPEATKITKMKTYMVGSATDEFASAVIQGSKNGTDWIDLYEIKEEQTEFTEITLNNPDYYQYYKILFNLKDDTSKSVLYEWQVSEYIALIPSTEHNEQVKIARIPGPIRFVWSATTEGKEIKLKTTNPTVINWGDGTTTDVEANSSSAISYTHTYSSEGEYVVEIEDNVVTYFTGTNQSIKDINIERATNLEELWIYYNYAIAKLNVSKNQKLRKLYCHGNLITELNVSNNTKLTHLSCGNNGLTELDVSKNVLLQDLNFMQALISKIDISKNIELTALNCRYNLLTELDVSNNTKLSSLYADPMPTEEQTTLQTITMATGQNIATLTKPESTTIVYK
jgi:hypothetical protein